MGIATNGPRRVHLPDGSRSVQSVWVWRGFLLMSLVALGLAIGLYSTGTTTYGVLWTVIAVGWFGISMYLWRQHVQWDDEESERNRIAASSSARSMTKSAPTKPAARPKSKNGRPNRRRASTQK